MLKRILRMITAKVYQRLRQVLELTTLSDGISEYTVGARRTALFRQALLASQELADGIDYCRVDLMLKKMKSISVK
jgi:uncharacterized protein YeaC (DUF1315 family)